MYNFDLDYSSSTLDGVQSFFQKKFSRVRMADSDEDEDKEEEGNDRDELAKTLFDSGDEDDIVSVTQREGLRKSLILYRFCGFGQRLTCRIWCHQRSF